MHWAGAGVLFTQLSGAISGLKDKPNELLCVRVQMRESVLPPSLPLHLSPSLVPALYPKGQSG